MANIINPKVSVIMSVYEGEQFLKGAVDSILDQGFQDFEFIIINDGSTDRTPEILDSYKDKRLKVINQENAGLTKSLNQAVKLAHGEYITYMDADDISLPQRLEKEVFYLDSHHDEVMLGVWTEYFSDNLPCIRQHCFMGNSRTILKRLVSHGNCFVHSSVIVKGEIIRKLGGYDERLVKSQDYELWLRLVTVSKLAIIPEILHRYRITTNSVSEEFAFETAKANWLVRKAYYFRQQGQQDGLSEALAEYEMRKYKLDPIFTSDQHHILGRRASLKND